MVSSCFANIRFTLLLMSKKIPSECFNFLQISYSLHIQYFPVLHRHCQNQTENHIFQPLQIAKFSGLPKILIPSTTSRKLGFGKTFFNRNHRKLLPCCCQYCLFIFPILSMTNHSPCLTREPLPIFDLYADIMVECVRLCQLGDKLTSLFQ